MKLFNGGQRAPFVKLSAFETEIAPERRRLRLISRHVKVYERAPRHLSSYLTPHLSSGKNNLNRFLIRYKDLTTNNLKRGGGGGGGWWDSFINVHRSENVFRWRRFRMWGRIYHASSAGSPRTYITGPEHPERDLEVRSVAFPAGVRAPNRLEERADTGIIQQI